MPRSSRHPREWVLADEIAQRAKVTTASVRYWALTVRHGLRELPKHDLPLIARLVA